MKTFIIGCLLFLCACHQPDIIPPSTRTDIAAVALKGSKVDTTSLGGEWYLVPVLASDTATGKVPMIRFDTGKNHFSGHTGCNRMSGEFWFSTADSSISFADKFDMSRMACPGYNERGFVKSLMHVDHFRLDSGSLILMTGNTPLSKWDRKPHPAPKMNKA
jgi:heat shock protein HslJ